MRDFAIVMLVKPFALLLLSAVVLIPARLGVQKYMREGWLKRLLLRRIS